MLNFKISAPTFSKEIYDLIVPEWCDILLYVEQNSNSNYPTDGRISINSYTEIIADFSDDAWIVSSCIGDDDNALSVCDKYHITKILKSLAFLYATDNDIEFDGDITVEFKQGEEDFNKILLHGQIKD